MAEDDSKTYRVRIDRVSAVRHPEHGGHVVPDPRMPYGADDPLVREYPWMFATDEQVAAEQAGVGPVESVSIETATRRPGERSNARRPAK